MAKTYQDTFTRAAAVLAGSTSSDGLFTWSIVDGSTPSTNGTAVISPATGGWAALTSAECDTENAYTEIDITLATSGCAIWLDLGSNGTYPGVGSSGYEFVLASGNAQILAIAGGAFTVLASVAHVLATGTYRGQRVGSTLSLYKDGVLVLSTSTSGEATGVGKRRALFGGDSGSANIDPFTISEFRFGDIAAAGLSFAVAEKQQETRVTF